MIPLRRLGAPRELGDVVSFLASDQAAYVTGATIAVDGGLTRGLLVAVRRLFSPGRAVVAGLVLLAVFAFVLWIARRTATCCCPTRQSRSSRA